MMNEPEQAGGGMPIACTLSGSELARRGEEVGDLFKGVTQVSELTDGYAFRFSGADSQATMLLEFILAERSCCPFFTFELVFEPQQRSTWLHLRGSAAIKEFVVNGWGEVLRAHA